MVYATEYSEFVSALHAMQCNHYNANLHKQE